LTERSPTDHLYHVSSNVVMMMLRILSHVSVCADLHDVDGAAQASAQRRWLRLSRQM
jgi:hypothetical protein